MKNGILGRGGLPLVIDQTLCKFLLNILRGMEKKYCRYIVLPTM